MAVVLAATPNKVAMPALMLAALLVTSFCTKRTVATVPGVPDRLKS